jgi:DtxR family Mn-dependent transcriptional regulator
MMNYSPVAALLIFVFVSVLIFLIFRPGKGWFWKWKRTPKNGGKVLTEDILKLMFHIQDAGKTADIHMLRDELSVDEGKLVYILSRMAAKDLLQIEGDKLILTKSGKDYALTVIRAHRLWEKYLAEKTGYDKSEWHERAEEMEHFLTGEETEKLAEKLGNPFYDPHGDPIPSKKGKTAEFNGVPLSRLTKGVKGRIIHLEDEPHHIYKEILKRNINIGSLIRVEGNDKNRIVFYSEGEHFTLSSAVAENITVSVISDEDFKDPGFFRLSLLKEGEKAKVVSISKEMRGDSRRRLLDLGFVKGTPIKVDLKSPMGNTKAFLVKGTSIALREDQASKILVKKGTV